MTSTRPASLDTVRAMTAAVRAAERGVAASRDRVQRALATATRPPRRLPW